MDMIGSRGNFFSQDFIYLGQRELVCKWGRGVAGGKGRGRNRFPTE